MLAYIPIKNVWFKSYGQKLNLDKNYPRSFFNQFFFFFMFPFPSLKMFI